MRDDRVIANLTAPHASDRRKFLAGSAASTVALVNPAPACTADEASLPIYVPGAPVQDLAPLELTAPAASARLGGIDLWDWGTGGSGPPMVFLHPAEGSGHVWGHQQRAFLAAGYRAIGYSRRGFRGSSAGDPEAPGNAADDLAKLADYLAIDRFHLIGTAACGFVAACFAIASPPVARLLQRAIPGSDLTILRDCGHSACWERPDDFNHTVLDFLARHA